MIHGSKSCMFPYVLNNGRKNIYIVYSCSRANNKCARSSLLRVVTGDRSIIWSSRVFFSKVKRMIQPPTIIKPYKLYHTGTIFIHHFFFRVDFFIAMKCTTNVQDCGTTIEVRNIGVRLRSRGNFSCTKRKVKWTRHRTEIEISYRGTEGFKNFLRNCSENLRRSKRQMNREKERRGHLTTQAGSSWGDDNTRRGNFFAQAVWSFPLLSSSPRTLSSHLDACPMILPDFHSSC